MLQIDWGILQDIVNKAVIVLPVVVGVVQVAKAAKMPDRWLPVFALVLGCLAGFFFLSWSALGVLVGAMMGLASVGLYEFGKTTIAGK